MGALRRFFRPARTVPVAPPVPAAFDHERAQEYELNHAQGTINESYVGLWEEIRARRQTGHLWHTADDEFFHGNAALFQEFVEYIRTRKCMEIGSGPYGFLAPADWIENRIIIDPLVEHYREHQIKLNGHTFFDHTIIRHAAPAETILPQYVGQIDGAIISRNALDHCNDPIAVLANMADYAASRCFLLLWTDIWHTDGLDEGHRNITRSAAAMAALLDGLGFNVIQPTSSVRHGDPSYIEYGVVARKR